MAGALWRHNVTHDPQFDGYPPEDPTIADKAFYAEWELINQGAKVATESGIRDLDDATGAYDHFLYGNGEPRTFSVEKFVREDGEGEVMLDEARKAAERASIELGNEPGTYRFVSNTVSHTGNPETENWQKTIGKAQYWTDTTVVVTENPDGTINRELSITINMEDKYDFNPGEGDIASGVSDDANGRFQVVGLADSYIHTGSATFTHSFDDDELSGPPTIHQPSDDGGRVRDESRSERDPLGGQRTSGAGRAQERNSVGDVAREN